MEFVEDQLGIDNLYEAANSPLVSYLNNALKAKELFKRDKDYIVMDGEVLIVDEFTGRILIGRRYNEGMHQAIEAKEHVEIKAENQTLATITLQNYFRLYDKLAGMTGTAKTEAAEFHEIYKLGVVPIPTNKPMIRADQADVIYKTAQAKFEACVDDIVERHEEGQPVLVGTTSVEKSEILSRMLKRRGIPHEVLNAKYHEHEAGIIAEAGRQRRDHRGHQHGRPRYRHHAGRQPRVHHRPRAAPSGACPRWRRRKTTRRPGPRRWPRPSAPWPRSTRRSSRPAACTCSAPSGTSRAASTTSCAAAPAARATRVSPASTCRWKTS